MSKYITIDGFETLTKQQLFDMAAKHILSTGKKSTDEHPGSERCLYSGSGCAAAPFIKEWERERADTKGSWRDLAQNFLVPANEYSFVGSLQKCHDTVSSGSTFLNEWKGKMRHLAKQEGLDDSVLGTN